MSIRVWLFFSTTWLLSGCGTLSYYGKPLEEGNPSTDGNTDAASDEAGDDDDEDTTTTGDDDDDDDDVVGDDDDDDDTTTPGDDDDTTTTGDDDDDDSTGACVYPAVGVPASTGAGAMPNPYFVGVNFTGLIVGSEVEDYTVDGLQYTSILRFSFYDYYANLMCEVIYDASGAIPAVGWTTDSGQPLWAAFDVPVSGGATSCGTVSAGSITDMRQWIEARTWGFGVGPMGGMEGTLSDAVDASGLDWDTDWAPYTYSIYITGGPFAGSGVATEASWAQSLDHICEDVPTDASYYATLVSPPTGAPLDDFVSGDAWIIYVLY